MRPSSLPKGKHLFLLMLMLLSTACCPEMALRPLLGRRKALVKLSLIPTLRGPALQCPPRLTPSLDARALHSSLLLLLLLLLCVSNRK